jgi:predicted nucleic acid-binding Zn ribbon protein
MEKICVIIDNIMLELRQTDGYKCAWLDFNWASFVGEKAAKHSAPRRVHQGTLWLNVDSAVWNQELFIQRNNLIKVINKKYEAEMIQDIRYNVNGN